MMSVEWKRPESIGRSTVFLTKQSILRDTPIPTAISFYKYSRVTTEQYWAAKQQFTQGRSKTKSEEANQTAPRRDQGG